MNAVYLDNHSATKPCRTALDWMKPYLEEEWAASFAPHRPGTAHMEAILHKQAFLADLVGASPENHCAFASSFSEALRLVYQSVYADVARKEGKGHILTGACEDAPFLYELKRLEDLGCTVKAIPYTAQGTLDLDQLRELINPRTSLVTISQAQSLSGVIQPVEEIAVICRERGVLLHLDATYTAGKIPLEFAADYLTLAGDRIHAPKNTAAVFAKRPLAEEPRSLDAASIAAFAGAAQQALLTLDAMALEVPRLRSRLEQGVLEAVPCASVLFADAFRLPNTSVIAFPGIHQETLLYRLNRKGVYAAIGGSYHALLSRICMAAGHTEALSATAVSFSLSRFTAEAEIERAIALIAETARELQRISL